MIIYQNSAKGFRESVDSNRIVQDIETEYIAKFGRHVGQGEKRSWNNSLRFMESILRNANVADDCGVLLEYNIPSTSKRIDFVISGHDEQNHENFVIIELKQWDSAAVSDKEDLVMAFVGGRNREMPHPSYQAYSYKRFIYDMNEAVYSDNLSAYSCAYLHNYQKNKPEPLTDRRYEDITSDTPVFFSEDHKQLQEFIYKYVGKGNGLDILYRIENGKIKPSKKFIEYVTNMFEGNEVYTLLDEQKVAYENIIKYATDTTGKRTILINGGPGTGKSVVAMNALVTLLNKELNIKFVAPNSAFRTAIVESLASRTKHSKKRLNVLFSGSGQFYDATADQFDALIVDEAHRLKGKGAYMYMGESQIKDIIKASKVNVFFIDDHQRIRPDDIGTTAEIQRIAEEHGSEVVYVQLQAQFRCSGAEGFLNWVDHTLQIRETGNFNGWDKEAFEFDMVDTPGELYERIKQKAKEGYKARMLAGFAWKWSSAKEGNYAGDIEDVTIEEHSFRMPWNGRDISTTWAIDPRGLHQIGCVHTSQGLEFDYAGVIIGNDLQFNPETMELYADYDNYRDVPGKKGLKKKPEELTALIKNIYKVLLSRGMKGCYVYCRDPHLQAYMKSRLNVGE